MWAVNFKTKTFRNFMQFIFINKLNFVATHRDSNVRKIDRKSGIITFLSHCLFFTFSWILVHDLKINGFSWSNHNLIIIKEDITEPYVNKSEYFFLLFFVLYFVSLLGAYKLLLFHCFALFTHSTNSTEIC